MTIRNTLQLPSTSRIQSIDFLRGLVMVIMTLDHARDFIHYDVSIGQDPLDFKTTTPFLFLTRWITHFCAPIFVFLSGTGMFLYSSKGRTKNQVAVFLLTRGLWLMFVEIFIILPLWNFNFDMLFLQVIWAIGLCMVVLSFLQFLKPPLLLVIGLAIIFGHNLLDPISVNAPFWKSLAWGIIHKRSEFQVSDSFMIFVTYPFLPWLGIMILGYLFGRLYLPATHRAFRKKMLVTSGIIAILLFIILRGINLYGDMYSWSAQKRTLFTIFDFVKTTKYPPSLLYTLMTIGPALIFLAYSETISNRIMSKLIVFGKVPFFFYILHVFVIHSISWLGFFLTGHSWKELDFTHFRDGSLPAGTGFPLGIVYLVWIITVFLLYFPCRWYSRYKAEHTHWWLSYI